MIETLPSLDDEDDGSLAMLRITGIDMNRSIIGTRIVPQDVYLLWW